MKSSFTPIVTRRIFYVSILVIGVLSLLPRGIIPELGVSDKLEHCVAYAGLAFLGGYSYPRKIRSVFFALLLCGIAYELGQTLVPDRGPSVWDVVANAIGAMLGCFAARFVLSHTKDERIYLRPTS